VEREPERDSNPPQLPELGSPQILVVDDDAKNLAAIEAVLSEFGGHLDMVRSGSQALHNLLEHDYALVLLDVHMPDLDGFETAQLIRQRGKTRHLPIIFITAYDQSDSRVLEGYKLGAVDFLFKPIEPAILRAKVSVFVELTRRTLEVKRQTEQLWLHERREALARLESERQEWERQRLRREMEQQRAVAEESAARAEQLSEIATQREAAQLELARINARLAEGDRRKNEFLAMLAHELRNPLAPLSYAVGLLGDSGDASVREMSERMSRQLAHLTRLVDDLLDVSRVTLGKIELLRETIDLRDAILDGIELGREALRNHGSQLRCELGDDPVLAGVDAVRIAQVVGNLLNNAARYTRQGGSVEIKLRTSGDRAILTVQDDGPGIPESMLETLFEAFVQGPSDAGGLGLGLHLVERLVHLHGGEIHASNREPRGARFDIELPLARASEHTAAPRLAVGKSATAPACGRCLQIAIIEDEDDVRALSKLLLEHWGHDIREATNGQSGIALVRDHADELDLVLIDIGLPDMAGYDVARVLTETLDGHCPPMVAVTGWGQHRDRERALASGFSSHLVKPVRPDALRETLNLLGGGRVPTSRTREDDDGK
jgi:signal transduction histidine kinase